jgi:hypothetical protein
MPFHKHIIAIAFVARDLKEVYSIRSSCQSPHVELNTIHFANYCDDTLVCVRKFGEQELYDSVKQRTLLAENEVGNGDFLKFSSS